MPTPTPAPTPTGTPSIYQPFTCVCLPSPSHQDGRARHPSARSRVRALPGAPGHQLPVRVLGLVGHLRGGSLGSNRHLFRATQTTRANTKQTVRIEFYNLTTTLRRLQRAALPFEGYWWYVALADLAFSTSWCSSRISRADHDTATSTATFNALPVRVVCQELQPSAALTPSPCA